MQEKEPRLLVFLKRWGIHQDRIAAYLGVSRGTLGSKIRGTCRHKFNRRERQAIVDYINAIPRVTEADLFDDDA